MTNGFPGPAPGPPGPPVTIWPPPVAGLPHVNRAVAASIRRFGSDVTYIENDTPPTETALRLRMRAPDLESGESFFHALGTPDPENSFPKAPEIGEFIKWGGEPYTIRNAVIVPGRVELWLQKQT